MKKKDISLVQFIEKLCSDAELELERSTENYFKINTGQASGISIILNIDDQNKLSFYFIQRTYDVFYEGDRTDAHVVLSLMFSVFLRLTDSPISSSLFDIPHPMIEDEIWGRYIMPDQMPFFLGSLSNFQLRNKIKDLIGVITIWRLIFWRTAGCPCNDCMQQENSRDYRIKDDLIKKTKILYGDSPHINYGSRIRPNWHYLYDMENEVTVIESIELSEYLEIILKNNTLAENTIQGVNGNLVVDKEVNNFISNTVRDEFYELFKSLNNNIKFNDTIIPLENMLVSVSKPYIIALGRLSGRFEFKAERELLRKRHNKEAALLFPIPSFVWIEKICPEQFENMIKALLEREPGVKNVRKPAPINQGDKGRDLIIEWTVFDKKEISEINPPTKTIRVVGQCKASNNSVGKSKVTDIRDTIETHNSNGYFLAVSTQITAPLTEKLESLKNKGTWTEWWNREDIEFRLSKNQDLIPNFPDVINVKNRIKFVDKD